MKGGKVLGPNNENHQIKLSAAAMDQHNRLLKLEE